MRWALYEPRAGYLLARQACAAAVEALVAAGGELRTAAALPGAAESGRLGPLHLSDASRLTADIYVFAAGPWLPRLFPEALRGRLEPTRQDVLFFGTPERDRRFDEEQMPVWIEFGERVFYGIPGNERRGFKVADDTRGPEFDPTAGERLVAPESLARARELLARRFPALADAPLVETRVCQYENTPDYDFLLDRLPAHRERLARRRRLGPRLQVRAGMGRAGRGHGARRAAGRSQVRAGAARAPGVDLRISPEEVTRWPSGCSRPNPRPMATTISSASDGRCGTG